ncbi:acetolactate synthase, large subunit, biosynthetic type [Bacillus sp. MUM 116]|uniref:biosynthetic-type acetolactate synthase large subunit n=1 Tax=Bacillus sp. MUM 116 TaxID=1678002 RepID=UPI0008F58FC4|nr:biosynthetic-type acetolactate synthase large subunit [Bacillus sp. MUM 116]OIK16496.1 acetolactate synthase, large subunit, biosynthetic type [Bacillus sp. MUM 116]
MFLEKEFKEEIDLSKSLKLSGVDCLFGCDDQGLIPGIDQSNIRYFQLNHEQAAVHAADGFARATGIPGVVLLSSAAGISNAITGIATAYSDSVPLVIIAGPLAAKPQNKEALQELDILGITMPITKYSFKLNDWGRFAEALQSALTIAADGRPGPVLIEYTMEPSADFQEEIPSYRRHARSQMREGQMEKSINSAVELFETARKPVLFIGGGVISSGAADSLREIVRQARIPVVSSLMGIGAMEAKNPLYLGMLGMHGTFAANKAVHQCDLLISIGVRFSDRVTGKISGFSPKSKKIHVDVDPAEINKIISVDLPIVSDAKAFLSKLKEKLNYNQIFRDAEMWTNEVIGWKRTVPRFDKYHSILSPQAVIKKLNEYSSRETIVVTDVGQHQIWTAHHYHFSSPRTLITSGGLGTMGYGLPAAIGAAAACPGKPVLCVSGDGSFQMNLQELIIAVKYQLPIKIAILNNGYLGMVRQWQELFYHGRYSSVKISSPNFAKLAEAYGVPGYKVRSEEEVERVIAEAFQHSGPALIEFDVVEEENVYPMVPPNHSNHQIILSR